MQSQLIETLLVLAYTMFMQEKYAKAKVLLSALEYIAPNNKDVLRLYSATLINLNIPQDALQYTEKLLTLEDSIGKNYEMAKYLHASALWQLGKEQEAQSFFLRTSIVV